MARAPVLNSSPVLLESKTRLAVALDPLPKARLTRHCSQNRLSFGAFGVFGAFGALGVEGLGPVLGGSGDL